MKALPQNYVLLGGTIEEALLKCKSLNTAAEKLLDMGCQNEDFFQDILSLRWHLLCSIEDSFKVMQFRDQEAVVGNFCEEARKVYENLFY